MQKIISLFKRNYEGNRQVFNELVSGAEWVISGEGVATEKIDGTACMIRGGKYFKRYDAKRGKTPPPDFEPAQEPDPITGHWPGWVPVSETNPADKWHREARNTDLNEGTFELIGPKIEGNPYKLEVHRLVKHGEYIISENLYERNFEGIKKFLSQTIIEGIVWHHPDGRMVKIKARDFGLIWPREE